MNHPLDEPRENHVILTNVQIMKALQLRKKKKADLLKQLEADKEKIQSLRFDIVAGKVKNVRDIRATRKEIAAIMTILSEK